MIRKICLSFFCVLFIVFGWWKISAENNPDDVLTVGVPSDRCPIFYVDDQTDEIVGIGVDLMQYAAEEAGYSVSFVPIAEDTLKEALDNDAYDVIMPFGSAIQSAEGKSTIVSENLMRTPFTFVSLPDQELPPIDELRVGMLHTLGGAIETLHHLFPQMTIVEYETMAESVSALRKHEVDALLHNSYVWSYVLQKPAFRDLIMHPSNVFSMDFRAGTLDTAKGSEIIERLNEGIAKIDDTKRQAIILDYTSRSLYQYDFSDYAYRYGFVVCMGLLLIAAGIIIIVQKMKAVRKAHEEQMKEMMDYDSMTGLLNLNGFRKRVEILLKEHPDRQYFLSYNNIKGMKFINESYGRKTGDELLKFWAEKSLSNLSDDEAICRSSGDHFVVLRHVASEEDTQADLKNVFYPVQNYFIDRGKDIRVQISSGIYILTKRDFKNPDVDHMIDLARLAEQKVSENRNLDHAYYNQEQWEKGKKTADIVNYLPKAIETEEIQVWYQPQIDYRTGRISGAEALCRWNHSKLGWLPPGEFIPILEEDGLIYELDCYVWEKVCRDLKKWNEAGAYRSVSVNVSRADIEANGNIPDLFERLVQDNGLRTDQLRIEITESAYAENAELLLDTTTKLRSLGFQVEMDDFGSGYSSLHMLKEVTVDRIKLDLNFLTSSGDQKKSEIIVSSMIGMVRQLGMELIAEGVETLEQAEFLHSRGCDEMQGYYFYKPMPVSEFEELFHKNQTETSHQ